jgi:hypothetical protein
VARATGFADVWVWLVAAGFEATWEVVGWSEGMGGAVVFVVEVAVR